LRRAYPIVPRTAYERTKVIAVLFLYALGLLAGRNLAFLFNDKESCMTDNPIPSEGDEHRRMPTPRSRLEERAARSMRAEDMLGLLAEAIDYEFLEIVLGCRGRKVPEDIRL
jgi:hypothetical protein